MYEPDAVTRGARVAVMLVQRGIDSSRIADIVDARADQIADAPDEPAVTAIVDAMDAAGDDLPSVAERWLRDRREADRRTPNPLHREFVNPLATGGRRW
jgi:hypothetical protein